MKKKILALVLTATMIFSLCACGKSTSADLAGQTVEGTVTAIDGGTITLQPSDSDSEEITFTVTDDTTYTKAAGGMSMPGGDGQAPSGEAPGGDGQAPSGEAPSGDGQAPSGDDQSSSDSSDQTATGVSTANADSNNQPPAKPDGDNSVAPSGDGQAPSGEAPSGNGQAPSGEAPSDNGSSDTSSDAPEMPSGEAPSGDGASADTSATLDDIAVGDTLTVVFDEDGNASEITIGSAQGGMGSSASNVTYTAVKEFDEDGELSGETVESTGTDEEAILVTDGTVSLSDLTVTRDSDDSTGGDNSSFYGVGASLLATGGTMKVSDSTITSDAAGGAGIFSYGDGVVYVADTTISTKQGTSGGIHVAGGGTLYAWDLDVTTQGESSAAIRSDRGSGTMVVDGGTYTSNGTGSPAIYSTADITVNDADLTANGAEAICIEGLNSIRLYNSNLTGNMPENEQNDCTWNVILYQSMSGDSEVGNSSFEMDGGTLTAKNGGMFYTTNTESSFVLNNVDITYSDDNPFFLKCTGNSNARGWGSAGANGADCTFTAIDQEMEGDIIWDSISQLDFYMTEGSTLTGAFVDDESNAGDGGDGYARLVVAKGCTWTVTADSTLTSLENAGSIVDANGKTVSIVGSDGTVYVKGDSSITVTVDNYSTTTDLTGAGSTTSFSDYQVERPSDL